MTHTEAYELTAVLSTAGPLLVIAAVWFDWKRRDSMRRFKRAQKLAAQKAVHRVLDDMQERELRANVRHDLFPRVLAAISDIEVRTMPVPDRLLEVVTA